MIASKVLMAFLMKSKRTSVWYWHCFLLFGYPAFVIENLR